MLHNYMRFMRLLQLKISYLCKYNKGRQSKVNAENLFLCKNWSAVIQADLHLSGLEQFVP